MGYSCNSSSLTCCRARGHHQHPSVTDGMPEWALSARLAYCPASRRGSANRTDTGRSAVGGGNHTKCPFPDLARVRFVGRRGSRRGACAVTRPNSKRRRRPRCRDLCNRCAAEASIKAFGSSSPNWRRDECPSRPFEHLTRASTASFDRAVFRITFCINDQSSRIERLRLFTCSGPHARCGAMRDFPRHGMGAARQPRTLSRSI